MASWSFAVSVWHPPSSSKPRVTINQPENNRCFLCTLEDIPQGGSKGFELAGQKLFAVRQRDKVYLYQNRCPHLDIPLEWEADQFLDSSNSMIMCANHGALFVINTGKCVTGPCSGRALVPVAYTLDNGNIFLDQP
jgi:nitrite reductase/ring-hydroxylating ferredoxin subunit